MTVGTLGCFCNVREILLSLMGVKSFALTPVGLRPNSPSTVRNRQSGVAQRLGLITSLIISETHERYRSCSMPHTQVHFLQITATASISTRNSGRNNPGTWTAVLMGGWLRSMYLSRTSRNSRKFDRSTK